MRGCEVWSLSTSDMHKINGVWNNSFGRIFGGLWRERVKSPQFYIKSLSATFTIDERMLLFCRKMFLSTNIILRAISCLVRCRSAYVGHQYGVETPPFPGLWVMFGWQMHFSCILK